MQQYPEVLFQRLEDVDWKGTSPTRQIRALTQSGATHIADLLLVEERAGLTKGSSRVCYIRDRPNTLREPNYTVRTGDIQRTDHLSRVRVRGMAPEGYRELRTIFAECFGLDLDEVDSNNFPWERLTA